MFFLVTFGVLRVCDCFLAAASAFKFFAGGIAGIYRFHLGSIGGNGDFFCGASFRVVVFTFFYVADQIFHLGNTSFCFIVDCVLSMSPKKFFILFSNEGK